MSAWLQTQLIILVLLGSSVGCLGDALKDLTSVEHPYRVAWKLVVAVVGIASAYYLVAVNS